MAVKKKETGAVEAVATWEKSTKRMERYKIGDNDEGVSGTLYVPKDGKMPKSLSITFKEQK